MSTIETMPAELADRVRKTQSDCQHARDCFSYMADHAESDANREALVAMAKEEDDLVAYTGDVTGIYPTEAEDAANAPFRMEAKCMGLMFSVHHVQNNHEHARELFNELGAYDTHATERFAEHVAKEASLTSQLDEERLHYTGDIILGLNDALVELTGALAGITFSLCDTKVVALTGIITGIAAALSMASSNYLAVKADGDGNAMKSMAVTGISYIAAVALLVAPYLLLPAGAYVEAFWIMISMVVVILLVFNFYMSVAKGTSFWKNFLSMVAVSLGVAAISFGIGIAAKVFLGITVA